MLHHRRFIADAMLGRLARWLRLLGLDTLYYRDISDGDLIRLALHDNRIILTRDTHFLKVKNLRNLFIVHSDNPVEQVMEVISLLDVKEFGPGRCARCNGVLDSVDRNTIIDQVPEYVFHNFSSFFKCRDCGNVYWEGTHLKRFREMIGQFREGHPGA